MKIANVLGLLLMNLQGNHLRGLKMPFPANGNMGSRGRVPGADDRALFSTVAVI